MAVAVIGGAGFIGSNLVDDLLVSGFEVTVFDDFSEGKMENLSRWKGNDKLEVVRGDIRDLHTLERVCDHKSWVFHLAGMSRVQPSMTDPQKAYDLNVMGTVNVAEACLKREVKRLVFSSTSAVYGDGPVSDFGVKEEQQTFPQSPYALSKLLAERILEDYRDNFGLSSVVLRYANVFGPRMPKDGSYATAIGIFRKQVAAGDDITITGDGKQRRDYVFVGDVVRANMMAAMNYEITGLLNVGSGRNFSINEVAELVAKGHPTKFIDARPGEARNTLLNIDKIKKSLGWKPEVNLEQGLHIMDMFEKMSTPSIIIALR